MQFVYFGAPKVAGPKGKVQKYTGGQGRRELNAPFTLVFPNPSQGQYNERYSRAYKNSIIKDMHPEQLVWYYFDEIDGRPYDPQVDGRPTIRGNVVDLENNSFDIGDIDLRDPVQNPYRHVTIKAKDLRVEALDNGKFKTAKLDTVAVENPNETSTVLYAGGGGTPMQFFTLHYSSPGVFDKWYGMFAAYNPTPPPSPPRDTGFGKRRKNILAKVDADIRYLKH
uniref:Uncharacterized protein n=1 Tax=viral metagenome TaxID=1070528 RepID=A0A6C0B0V8_9ZZZZ